MRLNRPAEANNKIPKPSNLGLFGQLTAFAVVLGATASKVEALARMDSAWVPSTAACLDKIEAEGIRVLFSTKPEDDHLRVYIAAQEGFSNLNPTSAVLNRVCADSHCTVSVTSWADGKGDLTLDCTRARSYAIPGS